MTQFLLNGRQVSTDAEVEKPLLWQLRDDMQLMGTKYSCGIGVCGACQVFLNGKIVKSCITPVSLAAGAEVVTIEGLESDRIAMSLRQAWLEEQVPQCGYCQSGMLISAVALLRSVASPTDEQIAEAIENLCRCGTYPRVRRAIHRAARMLADSGFPRVR